MEFSKILVDWFLPRQREMPWRKTNDPYKIWLSEIILQQTRIAQGLPYYLKFAKTFPTVFDLAKATEEKVLKLWQGLGYYSRARNLHHTAKFIAGEQNGRFPKNYRGLLKLKGVGEYTAAAIASICFDEPVPVVDGNVYRSLSRIFGVKMPIDSSQGKKEFKKLAEKLLDKKNPANHNQALMEFGALQCKPTAPDCGTCPFSSTCYAFQHGEIKQLPVKSKKTKVSTKHFNYLVFVSEKGETILQKREGKGIWQNLYEFPLVESEEEILQFKTENLPKINGIKTMIGEKKVALFNKKPIKHLLSHQKIFAKFWVVTCEFLPKTSSKNKYRKVKKTELKKYPVPVLVEKFIESYSFNK